MPGESLRTPIDAGMDPKVSEADARLHLPVLITSSFTVTAKAKRDYYTEKECLEINHRRSCNQF